jgi:hypothetical protein
MIQIYKNMIKQTDKTLKYFVYFYRGKIMVTTINGIRTIRMSSREDEKINIIAHPKDGTPGIQIASVDEYGDEEPHTIIYIENLDTLDDLIDQLDDLRRHY